MHKILHVDNDKGTLSRISLILQTKGYAVHQAGTLAEAREKALQTDYTVIITEMNLPDAEGHQIVEILKKIRPASKIVVMTGLRTTDSVIACMRAGATDYLLKSCNQEQLCEGIRKAVENKEQSPETAMLRGLNEMKDKFLTLVSHELRTPLTLVYGYLRILQRQSVDFSDDQMSLLNTIVKSSKQLIDIVNNMQSIAQADSGQIKIHMQPVFPRKLLADVVAEVKSSSTPRDLDIALEEGEELSSLNADRIRLHQVITELVQNSIKNTRDGGEIRLGTRSQDNCIILWVRDNGIGITEEEQAKIFEPFYEVADVRQHSSSNSCFGGGGLGIGLPLVKRVIEAHGGTVHIHSEINKGTTVELSLPLYFGHKTSYFSDKLGT